MDVGRRGRLYALHFELVAHLRFVDLDLGLTPAVGVPGPGTSFSPVKDASRVARGAASAGTAAISTSAKTSAASRVVSFLIDLYLLLRLGILSTLHILRFARNSGSCGSTFPANFAERRYREVRILRILGSSYSGSCIAPPPHPTASCANIHPHTPRTQNQSS